MKNSAALSVVTFCLLLSQIVAAQVTGSGTVNYVPLWTGTMKIGNSKLYQTGGNVGVGTTSPNATLDVVGHVNASQGFNIANYTALSMPGGPASGNVGVGVNALQSSTSGVNAAIGYYALQADTTGNGNTAAGGFALYSNVDGSSNTALGEGALQDNVHSNANTAVGSGALGNTTAGANTAVGASALAANTTGYENVAIGPYALWNNTMGAFNIAIGDSAAYNIPASSNYNIDIGNQGTSSDNGVIRIGVQGYQGAFFAAGIYGASSGGSGAIPVLVDSSGQLVTVSSSRRFKEDIHDMGDTSHDLMRLRPVTFRYKQPLADGSQPIQYGLIAEEVAEVYPDLVSYAADGQVQSVKYQLLDPMLLNEVQREHIEIETLQHRVQEIDALQRRLQDLESELAALTAKH